MSKLYEKFIARQELIRRGIRQAENEEARIRALPTSELEEILEEPDEPEEPTHE